MSYIDGFVVPVPESNRERYREEAQRMADKFRELGALSVVEAWGDDLPRGTTTDFFRATKAEDGENVVFSWIVWPSKEVRDTAWGKMMADMGSSGQPPEMPFDGKRMFWGGFVPIVGETEGKQP